MSTTIFQSAAISKSNSGYFVDLRMQFDSVCGVEEFARAARTWIEAGVEIVGGCCGIGPAHIEALAGARTPRDPASTVPLVEH